MACVSGRRVSVCGSARRTVWTTGYASAGRSYSCGGVSRTGIAREAYIVHLDFLVWGLLVLLNARIGLAGKQLRMSLHRPLARCLSISDDPRMAMGKIVRGDRGRVT